MKTPTESRNENELANQSRPQRGGYGELRKQLFLSLLTASVVYLFVIFATGVTPRAKAQVPTPDPTCTATVSPTPSPTQPPATPLPSCAVTPSLNNITDPPLTPVPSPSPGDGTILQWRIYSPSGSGPWPAVLLIHGGGFREGDPKGQQIETVAADLRDAGYYVAVPTYRLAPWGKITGQPCHDTSSASGRPPEQSNDVEAEIIALRGDSAHCNGKVGAVGGSAGGTWAAWAAFDTNSSGGSYPFWNTSDRVDCAVSLSGAYEFDDRTPQTDYTDHNQPDPLPAFAAIIENYTESDVPSTQHGYSPVALVTSVAKPVLLINSRYDPMPYHQIVDMICALEGVGLSEANGDFSVLTIPGNDHSFAYWNSWDGVELGPTRLVKSHVLEFLGTYLK